MIGYVVAWDKVAWTWPMFLLVALGYLMFAHGNRKVLLVAQDEVIAAGKAVEKVRENLAPGEQAPESQLKVTTVSRQYMQLFHWAMTSIVLLAIAVTWYMKSGQASHKLPESKAVECCCAALPSALNNSAPAKK